MASPLVSVILPVYNAQDTLSDAIASLQQQTLVNFEVLIMDDGSTDDSLRIAQQAACDDHRFRVFAGPHRGLPAVLREAMQYSAAPYWARMDADDVAHPQRMERQYQLLSSDPRLGLCGSHVHIIGPTVALGYQRYEAWLNGLSTHEDIRKNLFVECPLAHPTFFGRREAYEESGGYMESPYPEDYDLVFRIYEKGWRLANVPECLLQWRHRPGRLSQTHPRYGLQAFRSLKRTYLRRLFRKPQLPLYQWGAGEVGKLWLREWYPSELVAVIDIHPRKIGRTIHGIPVIPPESLPGPGRAQCVVVVGAPGAREEIRHWFSGRGYQEGSDYVFAA